MNRSLYTLAAALALLALLVAPADASPPAELNQGAIANAKQRPVDDTEEQHYGVALGTTTVHAIGPSATNADVTYSGYIFQNYRIVNLHASQYVCYDTVARGSAGVDSCETTCGAVAAGTLTCTGSGTADGTLILPGTVFSVSISGLECGCVEASAAATNINVTRVSRSSYQ